VNRKKLKASVNVSWILKPCPCGKKLRPVRFTASVDYMFVTVWNPRYLNLIHFPSCSTQMRVQPCRHSLLCCQTQCSQIISSENEFQTLPVARVYLSQQIHWGEGICLFRYAAYRNLRSEVMWKHETELLMYICDKQKKQGNRRTETKIGYK